MEVIFALVVTVMAVTIVSQGFSEGSRASVISQNRTRAAWLAGQKMTDVESEELAHNRGSEGTFAPDFPDHRWTMTSDSGGKTGLYKITIAVTWKERNEERSYELTRLLYRP